MRQIFLLVGIFFIACNDHNQSIQKTTIDSSASASQKINDDTIQKSKKIWVDRLNGKNYTVPDTIAGRPVSFYLNHLGVADIAKSFYKGKFRPEDNDSTTELLSYITTEDSILRAFYRWCLDHTILISDGALGEYPGSPALKYAIKFPLEFFEYMDQDVSGQRYKRWIEIMAYSGLDNYEKTTLQIEAEIIDHLKKNCRQCDSHTQNRFKIFAQDITKVIKLQE